MRRFIVRRLGLLLVTLWLMSIIVFVSDELVPGDVAHTILGQAATPQAIIALRVQLGLNYPAPVLYLRWIAGFVTGQWGFSPSFDAPIASLIPGRLGNSLVLAAAALIVLVPLSIGFGMVAALRQDRLSDRIISVTGVSLMAIPEFISGIVLLTVFGVWLHVLPTAGLAGGGSPLSSPQYLVLPALSLGIVLFGYMSRMMRASTIAVLDSAYVRTARLKGLPPRLLLTRHVLRNALVPVITVITSQIGYLIGGLVVIETLFSYPGIGSTLLYAGLRHDVPLLEDCVMVIAVIFMLSNLAADILYAYLNPQIRHSSS